MVKVNKKQALQQHPEPTSFQFETFRRIREYEKHSLQQSEPSCFNSEIRIRRYRVTIEAIEEPLDILKERLQSLWDRCDNHHHVMALQSEARRLGFKLEGERGRLRRDTAVE